MNPETESWPTADPVNPKQNYFWPIDTQLRKESLDNALNMFHHFDNKEKRSAEHICTEAEKFYKFLSAQNNTDRTSFKTNAN